MRTDDSLAFRSTSWVGAGLSTSASFYPATNDIGGTSSIFRLGAACGETLAKGINTMSMIIALGVVACILLLLASFNVPTGPVSIGWLGLFFLALSFVWGKL